MKYFLLSLSLLLLFACKHPVENNNITIGKIDSLHSKILGEERKIWVYLPEGAKDISKRFPVLYLLDGDAHFTGVVGMIKHLAGSGAGPDMIIVGIPNTDRTRDLTPTHSILMPGGDKDQTLKSSGGGEKFESFVAKELIPHIDSLYPVAPYKMLIGHSFGGLTVMNIMVHHPDMFNSYIAIDPSMWWDKQKLLNQARDEFKQSQYNGKSLYLGIANTMPDAMDTLQVRLDTTGETEHIRSILALKDILQRNKVDGLNFGYGYYKNDNHGSVPLITEYDGLRFLFGFYKMPNKMQSELFDKKSTADPVAGISAHYAEVSKHMGYSILPPEDMMNEMAYYLLQTQPKKCFALLQLNIKNYPKSENAYDSMGDYYSDQKNKAKAIEFYEKALAIKEVPETKKKLDSLQAKK
ncbi:MAG: alpha/beta hydrolase-fold protein [Sphingobacteriales bacterium]